MSAATLLARLDRVRQTAPDRWVARCPAHEDRSPSLSVRELPDGTVLVRCFVGCSVADIVGAVGLQLADLFPERLPAGEHHRAPRRAPPVPPADLWRLVRHEVHVLVIAAEDLAAGRALDEESLAAVRRAHTNLRAALEVQADG